MENQLGLRWRELVMLNDIYADAQERMDKALETLERDYRRLRTGEHPFHWWKASGWTTTARRHSQPIGDSDHSGSPNHYDPTLDTSVIGKLKKPF